MGLALPNMAAIDFLLISNGVVAFFIFHRIGQPEREFHKLRVREEPLPLELAHHRRCSR